MLIYINIIDYCYSITSINDIILFNLIIKIISLSIDIKFNY